MLLKTKLLISQSDIVTILIIVVIFFSVLLILGVRKSHKLKKENERLNNIDTKISDEDEQDYTDFTEGHMYDNK
ncbi:hypothetical protein Q4Q35_15495 [Flavivirga aquimarina]|uniref:Cbb3-type cytochrome oxidase assembly protein CcoS n=1 Tax=Flavivirga aquimarina TaxID=2027862 RepID=A0ABT8WDS4_9FLAO|nr:hypothetical protein [Flavivirga aquimarina]MDO5971212.1 hypothetical protein [Flavivirga aquimarina]